MAQTSAAVAVDKAAHLQAQIISMNDSAATTAEALGKALADVDAARADAAGATHSRNIVLHELSECQALLNEARDEHNRLRAALHAMEDQVGNWRDKHAAACSAERTRASELDEARQRAAGLVSSVEQLQQEITLLKEQESESQERLNCLSSNEGALRCELTACQDLLDEARREQERLRAESHDLAGELTDWRSKHATVKMEERGRGVMLDEGGFWASDGSEKCGVAMSLSGAVDCDTVVNSELQPSEKVRIFC